MKKILCVLISALMMLATFALAACNEPEAPATLKFGLGVHTAIEATDATAEANGKGEAEVTFAVITVDADGKVVACEIDTAASGVEYTADGKAVAATEFKTKGELKFDYNMVNYGGGKVTKEWFEQVDAFETVVVGKTLSEIKALVAEGDKGTQDVQTAGCTIMIADFVGAIEKAFANLADSDATAESTLKLGIATELEGIDASADANGSQELETTVFAAAVDAEGKVMASKIDCVQVKFEFDATGVAKTDLTKKVLSKGELKFDYNMVKYGGGKVTKEWFEQADAFNALCKGKTANEIKALCAADGKGTDAVKAAGCTILVDGMTKAAAKIG